MRAQRTARDRQGDKRRQRCPPPVSLSLLFLMLSAPVHAAEIAARLPEDETIYFVLVDRFENGDRSNEPRIDKR